jgi:hypothetical protein
MDGVLYNIIIEFGVAMKLVRLIKMCFLSQTYSKVLIGKHGLIRFLLRMVYNKEMLYGNCFATLL